MHIRHEVAACARACEQLLASGLNLTEDEQSLLESCFGYLFHHYRLHLPPIDKEAPIPWCGRR
jgi:hypothetical protein